MTTALELAKELISRPSVTPDDAGCQKLLVALLEPAGFVCETIHSEGVTNLWAKRGQGSPFVILAGHTDVVPAGPVDKWTTDPFTPAVRDGRLFGRGSADMKTALAAMVVAAREFVKNHPEHTGTIAFLVTSDEEGPATNGTKLVCDILKERGLRPDYCIVGEASSIERLGDTIKNGRRGTMSGRLAVMGIQGHIAYPAIAKNPIHLVLPALAELAQVRWDSGNDHFDPTSWQISNINAGTGADNVIPGEIVIDFNFRFSTEVTADGLKTLLTDILDKYALDYTLDWRISGQPFLTPAGPLFGMLSEAVSGVTGIMPELSTTGGTSDGRFIAQICPEVLEFGPPMTSIHQIDEHVLVDDIEPLMNIYLRTLQNIFKK